MTELTLKSTKYNLYCNSYSRAPIVHHTSTKLEKFNEYEPTVTIWTINIRSLNQREKKGKKDHKQATIWTCRNNELIKKITKRKSPGKWRRETERRTIEHVRPFYTEAKVSKDSPRNDRWGLNGVVLNGRGNCLRSTRLSGLSLW